VQHISSSDIFEALVKAKDRGVNVFIITDSRSYRLKTSLVYALQGYGVDVRMPSTHSETNKFAIFDDAIVFTGSYSWTDEASTHHSGNCVVLHEDLMVSKYVERFGMLWNSYE
jgi:phosphatidylserine/phosphatidylglycerophosphate/cardiolipin synthase-like enzyme